MNFWNLSTHDLTRRSTDPLWDLFGYDSLSTHDLTRRSTFASRIAACAITSFNSRPHKEVDYTPREG